MSRTHISKDKRSFIVKSSTCYFHIKKRISVDFQICISIPLSGKKIQYLIECLDDVVKSLIRMLPKVSEYVKKFDDNEFLFLRIDDVKLLEK